MRFTKEWLWDNGINCVEFLPSFSVAWFPDNIWCVEFRFITLMLRLWIGEQDDI